MTNKMRKGVSDSCTMFSDAGERVNMYVSIFSRKEWDEGKDTIQKSRYSKMNSNVFLKHNDRSALSYEEISL